MHGRIMMVFVPLVLVTAVFLASWLAVESNSRINRDAELDRMLRRDAVAAELAAAGPSGVRLEPGESIVGESVVGLPIDADLWPWTDAAVWSTPVGPRYDLVWETGPVRGALLRRWTIITLVLVTLCAVLAALAYPLARWVLRPVRDLDDAAHALADGDLTARVGQRAGPAELANLAASFNEMADRLEHSMRRERSFVAAASHHLGNLMTPLRLRIESFRGGPDEIEELRVELDRLESVVERLIELHRAEEHDAAPEVVDVGAVVDEAMGTWFMAAEQVRIDLRREGSYSAHARASAPIIEEVVDNLLDNAFKYAGHAPISVTVLRGLDNVRLVVADQGPGISPDEMGLAQGRFWRGPEYQNMPGSGLGLAIVDALALRCGGHVELRSPPSGGLEVTLVLERAVDLESPTAALTSERGVGKPQVAAS